MILSPEMWLGVSAGVSALFGVGVGALVSRGTSPKAHSHVPAMPPPAPVDLNHALETVLVKAMDSQAGMMERMQKLNVENAQLAIEGVQRRRYSKGGSKRAATAGRGGSGKFLRDCRLCLDPMISDPTTAEIIEHSSHRLRRKRETERPEPAPRQLEIKYEDRGDHIEAQVPEGLVVTGQDGIEQVECPDCGPGGHYGRPHQHVH